MRKCCLFIIAVLLLTVTGKAQSQPVTTKNGFSNENLSQSVHTVGPLSMVNHTPYQNEHINTGNHPKRVDNEDETTTQLVQLVRDATDLVRKTGESAFNEFRVPGSRWQQGESYIFVLDPEGNMLVHPDPALEGKNQLDLKDINGKLIIRGLIDAATTLPDKPEGWYHYEWPVPGGMIPRWKSSYVHRVIAPSGKPYIVGSGMYTDRMEKEFVVDLVQLAVGEIEKNGKGAFTAFYDPTGSFIVKDAYIFIIDEHGVELINPAFPNLEGRNLVDLKDTEGKFLVREMFERVLSDGAGWVNYMWPKPGESISTQKSTYVSRAKLGDEWVLVGCGVYLADAPKALPPDKKMTAPELMTLVRDAAKLFEQNGEHMYPDFRMQGSKWFRDDTYFFVWSLEGVRIFHAADSSSEGRDVTGLKDVLGRPIGKMFLDAAATTGGEGWVHYMYPEPGDIFPTWKSSFVKRVTFPSGKQYIIGAGIYNMEMDSAFIEDLVDHAAALVKENGKDAFDKLRDKKGPFLFMDTYVFVDDMNGVELVNAAQPSLEGKNLLNEKDLNGKFMVRDYISAALQNESAWVDYYWYQPGGDKMAHKYAFVRKVEHEGVIYIVGAGFYVQE